MILSDLRNYIKLHHQASLMDASHRFDIEPEALKGMLQRLVSKGCIEKIDINLSAGAHAVNAINPVLKFIAGLAKMKHPEINNTMTSETCLLVPL